MNKTKKIIIIVAIVITILALLGGTYAYWKWQLAAADRTTITLTYADGYSCTADGGGDITSNNVQLIPAHCTNSAYTIKRTVTVTPTLAGVDQLSLNLQLKIDNISQALSNSDNFRYALTKDNSSCTNNVFAEGTFKGKQNGDTVDLLTNKNYLSSQPDTYYLYIWLDSAETDIATMDQPFRFFLTGDCTNQPFDRYTVTFDANGGTVNVPSKEVAYGSKYGSLPTPTRTGYTFLGWNGKNKYNIESSYNNLFINPNTGVTSNNDSWVVSDYIEIDEEKTYKFHYENTTNNFNQFKVVYYDIDKNFISGIEESKSIQLYEKNFSIVEGANYMRLAYSVKVNGNVAERNNIQLEEGTEDTEWEPYYVTSSTTVTQEKNHTLTAIWEPETYTVTFVSNGGTISSGANWTGSGNTATKTVIAGKYYGNLPIPTRSGYTFKGWSFLPVGYQQLEYLESTGTQYIDTGYAFSSPNLMIRQKYLKNTNLQKNTFGVDLDSNPRSMHGNIWNKNCYLGNSNVGSGKFSEELEEVIELEFTFNSSSSPMAVWKKNGQIVYTYATNNSWEGTDYTDYVFATHCRSGASHKLIGRIYYHQMYSNDELVRYFIPSYNTSTSKYGLYDIVNNTFYPNNATSGSDFIGGSEIYITNNTIVTQTENHTLTAIWEPNS